MTDDSILGFGLISRETLREVTPFMPAGLPKLESVRDVQTRQANRKQLDAASLALRRIERAGASLRRAAAALASAERELKDAALHNADQMVRDAVAAGVPIARQPRQPRLNVRGDVIVPLDAYLRDVLAAEQTLRTRIETLRKGG